MKKKYAIGADIGGSHISTALFDLDKICIVEGSLAEQKVNNKATAGEILNDWSKSITQTLQNIYDGELLGIGFAMPGPFDYENGISLIKGVGKYENLYGINVGAELRKILNLPESLPFRYLNDAMSFAVGECWIGDASKFKNVVAITLGTGFGSAFLTNGVPIIEGERVPKMGYVYHIPYEQSIADDYFSTRWFVGEYENRTGTIVTGVKDIALKAVEEEKAKHLFEDFGRNIGNFLAPLLKRFNTDCLVIGGNVTGAYPLFGPAFQTALENHQINIEIIISELMETAAMAGSARLLSEEFWSKTKPLVSKI